MSIRIPVLGAFITRVLTGAGKGDLPGPCPSLSGHACCYKYGAVAYPKLNALLQTIGRAIIRDVSTQ